MLSFNLFFGFYLVGWVIGTGIAYCIHKYQTRRVAYA